MLPCHSPALVLSLDWGQQQVTRQIKAPRLTPRPQEIFDNDHRVVSQKGTSSGRFTFSSAEAGSHKICFTPSSSSGRHGWTSLTHDNGGIKLQLDLVIGETNQIESSDKNKLQDIASRVKDLNARIKDVRREQVFQRVRSHGYSPGIDQRFQSSSGEANSIAQAKSYPYSCLGHIR